MERKAITELFKHGGVSGLIAGVSTFPILLMLSLIQPIVDSFLVVPVDGYIDAFMISGTLSVSYGLAVMVLTIESTARKDYEPFRLARRIRNAVWGETKCNGSEYMLSERLHLKVRAKEKLIYYAPFYGQLGALK